MIWKLATLALSLVLFTSAQAAVITVTGTSDGSLAELADNGTCDLREAIKAANQNIPVGECPPGDGGPGEPELILFAVPLPATISMVSSLIIFRDLIIRGPGPGQLTIERYLPVFDTSAFFVTGSGGVGPDLVRMSGFRIANFHDRIGGAAIRASAPLELFDMEFVNNTSFWGAGALRVGVIRAERVSFIENSSTDIGDAGAVSCQECEFIDSVFRGNRGDKCEAIRATHLILNRVEVADNERADETDEDASAVCMISGEIVNSTIAINHGPIGIDAGCDVRISFSTIAFNAPPVFEPDDITIGLNHSRFSSGGDCPTVEGSILTGHDLDIRDEDGLDISYSVVTTPGSVVSPPTNVVGDPMLLPLSHLASRTRYLPFANGSPAFNLAICTDPDSVDQRLELRRPDVMFACDAGSYEQTDLINRIGMERGVGASPF